MNEKKRKFWGWGWEDFQLDPQFKLLIQAQLKQVLKIENFEHIEIPRLEDLRLKKPQFTLNDRLQSFSSAHLFDRASHTYGQSFRDVWRSLKQDFEAAPDYVAFPKNEADIQALYSFAQQEKIALIPFGGGSSVCGGVESRDFRQHQGVISVDMLHFDQVLAIDKESRSAHIQAGIYGPALETELKKSGFSLRHYPQSFEFSTLGGWLATRSGGHFATLYTHIDEFVQSIRMVSPEGILESTRLPGSGAGPSEERLVLGSEGILGIITSAWMRIQDIPQYKRTQSVQFDTFEAGVEAARQIAQSGLYPSNARLVDPWEALNNGLGNGKHSVFILGFESAQHPVDEPLKLGLEICRKLGGTWKEKPAKAASDPSAQAWKNAFLQAPYLRDELIQWGLIVETFETATTWDNFAKFHQEIQDCVKASLQELGIRGTLTCRFTHIYPDGPAPYYSVIAHGHPGKQLAQWDFIKARVSQKIVEQGGTITHHHAVGRDHQPYYQKQRSELFAKILAQAKLAADPQKILNPGVLLSEDEL